MIRHKVSCSGAPHSKQRAQNMSERQTAAERTVEKLSSRRLKRSLNRSAAAPVWLGFDLLYKNAAGLAGISVGQCGING